MQSTDTLSRDIRSMAGSKDFLKKITQLTSTFDTHWPDLSHLDRQILYFFFNFRFSISILNFKFDTMSFYYNAVHYLILTVEHLETSEYVLSTLNKVCMYLNQRHCRKEVDRLTPDLVLSRTECCGCPNVRVFVCVCSKRLQSFISCFSFSSVFLLLLTSWAEKRYLSFRELLHNKPLETTHGTFHFFF